MDSVIAKTDTLDDYQLSAATDDSGNTVAVWTSGNKIRYSLYSADSGLVAFLCSFVSYRFALAVIS